MGQKNLAHLLQRHRNQRCWKTQVINEVTTTQEEDPLTETKLWMETCRLLLVWIIYIGSRWEQISGKSWGANLRKQGHLNGFQGHWLWWQYKGKPRPRRPSAHSPDRSTCSRRGFRLRPRPLQECWCTRQISRCLLGSVPIGLPETAGLFWVFPGTVWFWVWPGPAWFWAGRMERRRRRQQWGEGERREGLLKKDFWKPLLLEMSWGEVGEGEGQRGLYLKKALPRFRFVQYKDHENPPSWNLGVILWGKM